MARRNSRAELTSGLNELYVDVNTSGNNSEENLLSPFHKKHK